MKRFTVTALLVLGLMGRAHVASANPITDPDDPRSWLGATVGTFATLYFGANNATTRQQVVDAGLLDDGLFNPFGYSAGTLITSVGEFSGQGGGTSLDLTGTGSFDYVCCGAAATRFAAANAIDNQWMQTSGVVGETVFDLGFDATKAAVFNTIDHGPLPQEAIESTIYLSNDRISWTQAVVERVWLEGFMTNLGIKWDGFVYAVGTGTSSTVPLCLGDSRRPGRAHQRWRRTKSTASLASGRTSPLPPCPSRPRSALCSSASARRSPVVVV